MSSIEILPVEGLGRFLAFCRLPRQLYSGNKGFAPSLDAERWTLHAHKLNPHFKNVTAKAWLARKDGKICGRIFAQVYNANIEPVGASRAQFGSLDAIEDQSVVTALVSTAEDWLKAQGAHVIHGPFSPSVNSETGMLVEGFDAQPMIFMPWHPPYLARMLEALGYTKARDLLSYRYEVTQEDFDEQRSVMSRPEWRDRLKIRTLDLKNLGSESEILTDIFNDAWSQNWGFVPLSVEEFMSMADGLKYIVPEDAGFVIELDGATAAFAIILPNLHEMTADLEGRLLPTGLFKLIPRIRAQKFTSARIALFGVRRALQRSMAGGAVILSFIEELRRRGRKYDVRNIEFGWVLEDNIGMRRPIEMTRAKVDKIHRLYEKKLSV